ncbi:hypothetical protein KI387_030817, partial [Taxus chinensis]
KKGAEVLVLGSNGSVELNGEGLKKKVAVIIKGGDELVLSSMCHHTYIFQLLTSEEVSTPALPSSVGREENQVVTGKAEKNIVGATELSEALAAMLGPLQAPLLGSLPSLLPGLPNHNLPYSSSKHGEEIDQGSETSQSQAACDMSDGSASDTEEVEVEAALEPGSSPVFGVLRCRRKSDKTDYMCNGIDGNSLTQVCEDRRQSGRGIDPSVAHAKCQTLKEDLRKGIVDGSETHVSFDGFPYYL